MYIDPNTGGMLFQILAVLFATLSGIILLLSGKIRMFFAKLRRRTKETVSKLEEHSESSDVE
jgi:hypothetical protein